MESLIFFAIWAILIFLVMRGGGGYSAHIAQTGQDRGETPGGGAGTGLAGHLLNPPERDTDPVCGKIVVTQRAKPSVHDGRVYYFCSRDCREIFEAAPAYYLDGGIDNHDKVEHSHA